MDEIVKTIKLHSECPCAGCSGYVDRTLYEVGYRDNCELCGFEGVCLADDNNPYDEPMIDILDIDSWSQI